jgi:hypothetical protein
VSDEGVDAGEEGIPGKVYYEIAHGRRIAYQYLDPGKPPKQRRRHRLKKTWAKIPYERGILLAKDLRNPAWAVLLVLYHLCFFEKNNQVKLTNDLLGQFGISEESKSCGLRQLEREGVVTVKRRRGASPLVTLHWCAQDGEPN